MSRVVGPALVMLGVVLVLLAAIYAGQRRLIYFPHAEVPHPAAVGVPDVEPVTFATADGETLRGWFLPALRAPAWYTVIVFNGNAGNRAYRAPLATALRAHGMAVLLFDYRGFGGSSGTPTEQGLEADARAARDFVVKRPDVARDRLVYFGESLGAAVAVTLATEHPPAALVLRSPFVSMAAIGQFHYPLLPVRWLLRDRFGSMARMPAVRAPLLVIAGDRDGIVPLDQSRRLYAAASSPQKALVILEGADHNDHELAAGAQMTARVAGFLQQLR